MIFHRAATLRRPFSPRVAGFLSFSVFTVAALVFAQLVSAQDPVVPSDDVIRINTDLVIVPVFVTDSQGRRIPGLTKGDFAVSDAGSPVEVAYFAAGAERVALAFLLDASGSTRDIIKQQQETALALFSRFGKGSRVAVLHFREQAELVAPFTTDTEKVRAAFRFPAFPNRRTAIFDAAHAAVRAYAANGNDRTERRIVILISDGLDTVSKTRASTVIDEAGGLGVSFYVIHLPLFAPRDGRLVPRPPSKGFRELAEKTGGKFFVVGDAESSLDPHPAADLAPVFQAIAEDLQGQYLLGYYAGDRAARDGRYHRIEVRLNSQNRRKLRVRTLREGYLLQ